MTLWGSGSLNLRRFDDDSYGGVCYTTNVELGRHEGFADLSESAVSRIVSFLVLNYLGDEAVKEAAGSLLEIHQHYQAIDRAQFPEPKKLPTLTAGAVIRDPRKSKVLEAD